MGAMQPSRSLRIEHDAAPAPSPATEYVIETEHLSLCYGRKRALNDLTLRVPRNCAALQDEIDLRQPQSEQPKRSQGIRVETIESRLIQRGRGALCERLNASQ